MEEVITRGKIPATKGVYHEARDERGGAVKAVVYYLGKLTLRGGDHDGQPFKVLSWERKFITGAFKTPGDSALTVARGDGKSALVAALASASARFTYLIHDYPATNHRRDSRYRSRAVNAHSWFLCLFISSNSRRTDSFGMPVSQP